jgi:uncharacterized DUF497 family protein
LDSELLFEWDDANRDHISRHAVTPEEAEQVIKNDPLDIMVDSDEGEERTTSVGQTNQGRVLLVVTTIRETRLRVVTAFPPPKSLMDFYFLEKGANLDG